MTNELALLAHWPVRQKLNREFSSVQLRRSVRALRTLLVVVGSRFRFHVILVHSLRKVADSPGVGTHVVSEHEIPEYPEPRGVVGQTLVELGGDAPDLRQAVVRDVREIMMLDVIAEVIDEEIARAVVAARRLALGEEIVLGDKVPSQGVEPQSQEGPDEKVHQRLEAEEVED